MSTISINSEVYNMDSDDIRRQSISQALWEYFEKKCGYIPMAILKRALEDKYRANQLAIRKVTKQMLEKDGYIITYIRTELVQSLSPEEIVRYYGPKYCQNPANFTFEDGELDALELAIQKIISEKNFFSEYSVIVDRISKEALRHHQLLNRRKKKITVSTTNNANESAGSSISNGTMMDNIKQNYEEVEGKLKNAINTINTAQGNDANQLSNVFKLKIEFNVKSVNYEANIDCPTCNKQLLVAKTPAGYWMLGNVTRHFRSHLPKSNDTKKVNKKASEKRDSKNLGEKINENQLKDLENDCFQNQSSSQESNLQSDFESNSTGKKRKRKQALTSDLPNKEGSYESNSLTDETDSHTINRNEDDLLGLQNSGLTGNDVTKTSAGCQLCKDGETGGAHTCLQCGKFVHIFCSAPISSNGEDEGYGQKRLCFSCKGTNEKQSLAGPVSSNPSQHSFKSTTAKGNSSQNSQLTQRTTTDDTPLLERVPFMINGLMLLANKKKSNVNEPHVTTTCAFDSFYHVIAYAISQHDTYKDYLLTLQNSILNFIIRIVEKGCIEMCADLFIGRAQLLIDNNFTSSRALRSRSRTNSAINNKSASFNKNEILDATGNVIPIAFKAFCNAPSMQRSQSCVQCNSVDRPLPSDFAFKVDVVKLRNEGYGQLQKLIDDELNIKLDCRNCMTTTQTYLTATSTVKSFDHIYFDTSSFLENETKDCLLSAIPKNIRVLDKTYVIAGLSSYEFSSEHYIAYSYVESRWIELDDLKSAPIEVRDLESRFVQPHFILYVLDRQAL